MAHLLWLGKRGLKRIRALQEETAGDGGWQGLALEKSVALDPESFALIRQLPHEFPILAYQRVRLRFGHRVPRLFVPAPETSS